MSFYKYISKRLYDQSFMPCTQIINNMEMYRGVSTSLPPGRLHCLTIRRTCSCKFSQLVKMKEIYLSCY